MATNFLDPESVSLLFPSSIGPKLAAVKSFEVLKIWVSYVPILGHKDPEISILAKMVENRQICPTDAKTDLTPKN